jgi:hypothetical protein
VSTFLVQAHRAAAAIVLLAVIGFGHVAHADDGDAARTAFREGAALVEQSEWASALAAFERSLALRPYTLTLYNIGVCQRFLGRYTLAASTLRRTIAQNKQSGEMPQLFLDQANAYLEEITRKLARVTVTLSPKNAATAIDGRPLEPGDNPGELVAGIAAAGEPKTVNADRFVVVIDPGAHVFTFQLEGHDTIEVRRDIKPGASVELSMSLTQQDAEMVIDSNRARSVVRVDDVDVGLTPVRVTRPPGSHVVTVAQAGFVTYKSGVSLRPGQKMRLAADMPVEQIPITKRWYFWTAAVGVVATGAAVTWLATRPDPQPPAYERGSTGWLIETR